MKFWYIERIVAALELIFANVTEMLYHSVLAETSCSMACEQESLCDCPLLRIRIESLRNFGGLSTYDLNKILTRPKMYLSEVTRHQTQSEIKM